jgi:DNA-binding transcriptional regulator YiaG
LALHYFIALWHVAQENAKAMQYGHELTELRERKFWSQAMLAAELGVATTTVWRWERMQQLPKSCLLRLRRWAQANAKRQPNEPTTALTWNKKRGRPRLDQF